LRDVEDGSFIRQAALRFDVSASAAVKLMRRFRPRGSPAPARFRGHRRPILGPRDTLVRAILDSKSTTAHRTVRMWRRIAGVARAAAQFCGTWNYRCTACAPISIG
jgi:putative transposase